MTTLALTTALSIFTLNTHSTSPETTFDQRAKEIYINAPVDDILTKDTTHIAAAYPEKHLFNKLNWQNIDASLRPDSLSVEGKQLVRTTEKAQGDLRIVRYEESTDSLSKLIVYRYIVSETEEYQDVVSPSPETLAEFSNLIIYYGPEPLIITEEIIDRWLESAYKRLHPHKESSYKLERAELLKLIIHCINRAIETGEFQDPLLFKLLMSVINNEE